MCLTYWCCRELWWKTTRGPQVGMGLRWCWECIFLLSEFSLPVNCWSSGLAIAAAKALWTVRSGAGSFGWGLGSAYSVDWAMRMGSQGNLDHGIPRGFCGIQWSNPGFVKDGKSLWERRQSNAKALFAERCTCYLQLGLQLVPAPVLPAASAPCILLCKCVWAERQLFYTVTDISYPKGCVIW